jgi:hypothetical protein
MIICDKKKFVFIHIPKNSGTAMTKELQKTYKDTQLMMKTERNGINIGIDKMHLYYDVIDKFISKNILDNYCKFCIIRNPYNKLYSAWHFIKERHGYSDVNDFIKYKLNEEFIYGKELIPRDARVHYRPQFTFVYNNENNKFADFIIRYENLNEDISKMNEKYGLNIPLYDNGNSQKSYINLLNKDSIIKINSLYKKDFELFNYEMI